ncbi:MAG: LamG domain-containing protein [Candidatus Marinimicrobia bacterium]|nr:LamG domain-containing protein [Candidatus Neomarinimicrobiota bacterium]
MKRLFRGVDRSRRVWAGLALLAGLAADPLRAVELQYPLAGNLDPGQGTIELWVRPDVDALEDPGRFYVHYPVSVRCDDGSALSLFWSHSLGYRVSASRAGEAVLNTPAMRPVVRTWVRAGTTDALAPGRWHHVAVTWQGNELAIYFNGERVAYTAASAPMVLTDAGTLRIGTGESRIAVANLVVSGIARSADDLRARPAGPAVVDEHTLLLDRFATAEGLETQAEMIAGFSGETGGRLSGTDWVSVAGPFGGRALQLYREPGAADAAPEPPTAEAAPVRQTPEAFAGLRQFEQPLLAVPANSAAIRLDGVIEEDEWADASLVSGFVQAALYSETGGRDVFLMPGEHRIWLKSDGAFLNVGFQFAGPFPDDADLFELCWLAPGGDNHALTADRSGRLRHRVVSADSRASAAPGAAEVGEYRTQALDETWSGELRLDLARLGIAPPQAGESWPLAVGRRNPKTARSGWSYLGDGEQRPETYGRIVFTEGLAVRIERLGGLVRNRFGAVFEWVNKGERAHTLRLETGTGRLGQESPHRLRLPDFRAGMAFEEETLFIEDYRRGAQEIPLPPGSRVRTVVSQPIRPGVAGIFEYALEADDQRLAAGTVLFRNPRVSLYPVEIAKALITEGQVRVTLRRGALTGEKEIRLVLEQDGRVLDAQTRTVGPEDVVFTLNVEAYAPGDYTLAIAGARGEERVPLRLPEPPVWLGNPLGLDPATVPPPWTPLELSDDGRRVTAGFKALDFAGGLPLPSAIRVFDQALLAAPIRLVVDDAGGRRALNAGALAVREQGPGRAVYTSQVADQATRISAKVQVEFDGFTWVELALEPAGTLREFTLEIPLRAEVGRFYTKLYEGLPRPVGKYAWEERVWAGAIPEEGMRLGFCAAVWVGAPGGGLEWLTESNRNWHNREHETHAIEILREPGITLLRIRFVDVPVESAEPLEYAFGLTPTPMRDNRTALNYYRDIAEVGCGKFHASGDWERRFVAGERESPSAPGGRDLGFWYYGRPAPAHFARGVVAVYPLLENFDPRAGTIEFRVREEADCAPGELDLMWLDLGPGQGLHMAWGSADWAAPGRALRLAAYEAPGREPVIWTAQTPAWEPGIFRHLALTWEREADRTRLKLYGEGRLLAEGTTALDPAAGNPRDRRLFLGGNTRAAFAELRISARPRSAWELDRPPARDAETLLLDRFTGGFTPNDYRQTRAEVTSGASAETGGWVDLWAEFVPGPFGGALRLSTTRERTLFEINQALGAQTFYGRHIDRFHALWAPQGPALDAAATAWARSVDDAGARSKFYFGKLISPEDPYWDDYGAELALSPLRPSINNFVLCPNGPGEDYFVWATAQMLNRYGAGGVHMDYGNVWPCNHVGHGCGWQDESGEIRTTFPMLAHRRMYWRLYRLIHGRPDRTGTLKIHNSDGMPYAAIGMADYVVGGEMENFIRREGQIGDWLSWDRYLAFYSERTTGVPLRTKDVPAVWPLLMGDGTDANASRMGRVFALIRDGQLAPFRTPDTAGAGGPGRGTELLYYPAFSDFAGSRMLGFWEPEVYARILPEDDYAARYLRVNLFLHPDGEQILAVLGNLANEDREVTLRFDLEAFGFRAENTAVRDVYTREVLAYDNLRLTAPREEVRLLLLRRRKETP